LICLVGLFGCGGGGPTKKTVSYDTAIANAEKNPNPFTRANELINIAANQKKDGDSYNGATTLKKALSAAQTIEDPNERATALSKCAESFVGMGKKSDGRKALAAAGEAAEKIEGAERQAQALATVAGLQAKLGEVTDASATFATAEKMAQGLSDPAGKVVVLLGLAKAAHTAKLDEPAQKFLTSATSIVESIEDVRKKSDAFGDLAAVEKGLGKTAEATKDFQRAVDLSKEITDNTSKCFALIGIARKMRESGFRAESIPVLDQAYALAGGLSQGESNEANDQINRIKKL